MSQKTVACVACPGYSSELVQSSISRLIDNLGGFPDKVLNAKRILLKPNLLSARDPSEAVTTHPEIVRAVVREIRRNTKADSLEISLGDSPAGNYSPQELWSKTGMLSVAREEDIGLLPFREAKKLEIPDFGIVPVLKDLDDFDALVNLPKLKTHMLTKMTGAVKNLYGLVPGPAKSNFHGKFSSPRRMAEFLGALYSVLRSDFTVMDAVESLAGNGPSNGYPFKSGLIFASSDEISLDVCASELYGYSHSEIPLLAFAAKYSGGKENFADAIERAGDGFARLSEIRAPLGSSRLLHFFPEFIFHPLSLILNARPFIDQSLCVRCGRCAEACSQNAITKDSGGRFILDKRKCIVCVCCIESCDRHAIDIRSPAGMIRKLFSKR